MNNNSSLKEYYIKLQGMYNNAVNMLTAINQSLSTSASEITVNVSDNKNNPVSIRIPSFLYLENKIEQLDSNFKALFDMPASGEAWFHQSANMYKLKMIKSNSAPVTPVVNTKDIFANTKENNILKDLVNPKTYLKLDISNLPDNIEDIYMKKFIFFNKSIYDELKTRKAVTYEDYKAILYNLNKGIDYEEYDTVIHTPVKQDEYKSSFKIIEIPSLETGNPWTDITNTAHSHLKYKLRLDTLKYINQEDSSIEYSLKQGDLLSLDNENVIYKILNVSNHKIDGSLEHEYIVELEEYIGHIALQTYAENSSMILKLHNADYSKYHYVEIPLEENPYICVFIGTVYNNVRSILSDGILLDLNDIFIKDTNGNFIYDGNSSNPMSYIQYYNKYCKNIGDLILGITETAYPQLSNYSNEQLKELQESINIQNAVSVTIDNEKILVVDKINTHLVDDVTSENIINLHAQKSEINSQLSALQANIDQVYNQLISTDFNQEVSLTQSSLRAKLDKYYQERLILQKQQIAIIDNINVLKGEAKGLSNSKFRIRGITQTKDLEAMLHSTYGNTCDLIGIEIQYKYKSIGTDTTNVKDINSSIFSDWNKSVSYDKERKLLFDDETNSYKIVYENYDTSNSEIKWNMVDIPITQGEDVVIRIRYKYSIGQPFINLYTPWSDNVTMIFPAQFTETTEISSIIEANENDTIGAKFSNTLITEGYQEHVSNKIIDNSQVFYHLPENIYSGFNTPENKFISLKDKLQNMTNDIDAYKSLINNELNAEYAVYLQLGNENNNDNTILLSNDTENNITINEGISDTNDKFIKKKMNLIIKNIGKTPINFYSIFPGSVNTPMLLDSEQFYEKHIRHYERIPLLIGESNIPYENIYYQTLGQWIYFRQNNPYTYKDLYYTSYNGRVSDVQNAVKYNETTVTHVYPDGQTITNYLSKNSLQGLLGYRKRVLDEMFEKNKATWNRLYKDEKGNYVILNDTTDTTLNYAKLPIEFFIPVNETNVKTNDYLLCYEHICGQKNTSVKYLSTDDSISNFITDFKPNYQNTILTKDKLNGAFLIPHIQSNTELLCNNDNKTQYKKLDVGKSMSIPVDFEYYLDGTTLSSITKTLCFDLRSSLIKDPEHYILNITAKYDFTAISGDMNNITSLTDALTE